MNNVFMSIDIETTGLIPGFNEIIQVSLIEFSINHTLINHYFTNIKPTLWNNFSLESQSNNHLTPDILKMAPSSLEVKSSLLEWLEETYWPNKILIYGWNYKGFDQHFIKLWLGQALYDKYFYYHSIDVDQILIENILFGNNKFKFKKGVPSLKETCIKLNIESDNHNSLSDANSVIKIHEIIERDLYE